MDRQSKAPIDCFYVYPTVSTRPGGEQRHDRGPEERNVVQQQLARFGSECRLFAPIYRQVTLAGLRTRLAGGELALDRGRGYDDVRDAWRHYLSTTTAAAASCSSATRRARWCSPR